MYLGIDLGTSEVKALVIDENNEIVATHSAPLTTLVRTIAASLVGSDGIFNVDPAGKMRSPLAGDQSHWPFWSNAWCRPVG